MTRIVLYPEEPRERVQSWIDSGGGQQIGTLRGAPFATEYKADGYGRIMSRDDIYVGGWEVAGDNIEIRIEDR